MGLLDFNSKVLTTYKADVSDHVKELQKLKGAEKEAATAKLAQLKEINDRTEDHIKTLGKVSLAISAIAVVGAAAWDGMKLGAERARLESAAMGLSLDKLKTASLGLRGETDLLRDAARLQSGEFKATDAQAQIVEKSIIALTRKYGDQADVAKKVLDATTSLKTDGLQDLGVFVDKAGASMDTASGRAKIYEATLAKLAEVSGSVKDGQLSAGEQMQATTNQLSESWDKLKISLGELATAFEPVLLVLTKLAEITGGFFGELLKAPDWTDKTGQQARARAAIAAYNAGATEYDALQIYKTGVAPGPQSIFGADANAPYQPFYTPLTLEQGLPFGARGFERVGTGGSPERFTPQRIAGGNLHQGYGYYYGTLYSALGDDRGQLGSAVGYSDLSQIPLTDSQALTNNWRDRLAKRDTTLLEEMFGKKEEFDLYKSLFDGLTSSITGAYNALVDGTMSAGAALKSGIREMLKGLGARMLVRSAEEVAEGVAALANPNPVWGAASAATHFKAAGLFAAGAVLAGTAASQISAGGASSPTGSAGQPGGVAGGGRAGGSGPPQAGEHIMYLIGDPFGESSPRRQIANRRRAIERALGSSGVQYR